MIWAIIIGIFLISGIFTYSLCTVAKRSDELSEKYWRENSKGDRK